MDRYFKIIANENGNNEEIIIKENNLISALTEVNMNADFINKAIECDERGVELNKSTNALHIKHVSNNEMAVCVHDPADCPKYMNGKKGCEGCEHWQ